jgi:endonuclease/exonuclease/phosphatase family metal-dependent hydrolase
VQLEDKETKVRFTIYSTHYGFYKSNDVYNKIYQQMIGAFNERPGYSFWMGDFNIGYKNKAYNTMVDQEKIIDLWDLSEAMKVDGHCTVGEFKNGSYNGFTKPEGHGVYGDFIWARVQNNMAIDHYQYCYEMPAVDDRGIGPGYVSDHFAVFAEVRINTDISYKDYYKLLAEGQEAT